MVRVDGGMNKSGVGAYLQVMAIANTAGNVACMVIDQRFI